MPQEEEFTAELKHELQKAGFIKVTDDEQKQQSDQNGR